MKLTSILVVFLLVSGAVAAQTLTPVILPKFIQGAGRGTANQRRVPFVCRLTVSGLNPNTTYFYYSGFLTDTTNSINIGTGVFISVTDTGFVRIPIPTMLPGQHGEFVTNGSGSYTGWFASDASATTGFSPGLNLYFRLLLNDGMGGEFIQKYITLPQSIRTINFGADSASGTGLRATPLNKASAKQFIFLYDNFEASGRPVTGSFIENDGSDGSLANGYAPFYADSVNGINRAFGTILPNALPQGLRRMDLFELGNGAFKRSYFPYPVIESLHPFTLGFRWPSVSHTLIDTKNPSGGLDEVLVIDGSWVLGINLWLAGEAFTEDEIALQWATPSTEEVAEFVVEKSADGKTFQPVSTVRKGDNKQIYELKDTRTSTASFYRVVMKGKDGSRTVSEALKVDGFIKINIFPNPVVDQLLVQHPAAEAGSTIQVIGVDGRRLLNQNVAEGAVQTKVNVNKLIAGSYYVVYNVNGQRQSKSFIKK